MAAKAASDHDARKATSSASDLAGSRRWPEPKPLPDGLAAVPAFDMAFLPANVAPGLPTSPSGCNARPISSRFLQWSRSGQS